MISGTIPAGVSRPALGLVQGSEVLGDLSQDRQVLPVALAWLAAAQHPTRSASLVDGELLRRWVDEPCAAIAADLRDRRARAGLARVRADLRADLLGAGVVIADLHRVSDLGRWWFAPGLDEVVQVDGWEATGRGACEIDAIVLLAAARAEATGSGSVVGALGELLSTGWSEPEAEALAPVWGANGDLRPSTLVLLALLWVAESHPEAAGGVDEVEAVLSHLAPGGVLDPEVADVALVVERPAPDGPAERAVAAIDAAIVRADRRAEDRRARVRVAGGTTVGVLLWVLGTWGLDPATMSDVGLVSILRPIAWVGVAVLLAAFAVELASRRPSGGRLAVPVVALVAVLHATPAWMYGSLRYSWAWKHLGIIEFIGRTGSVDPNIEALDVYHSWPGFFSVNSAITDLVGLADPVAYARWWPLLANLVAIPVLLFVYRGLGAERSPRTAWLAVLLFTAANWIGQDYFSPQSMAFLLHLVVIGIVLQFTASPGPDESGAVPERTSRWSVGVAVVAAAAIVTSHQVTPVVLLVSLVGLAVARRRRVGTLLLLIGALGLLWAVTGAKPYLSENVASLVEGFADPVSNADENLVDAGQLSDGQALVSTMGRLLLLAVASLAGIGVLRELRHRRFDLTALVLLLAPGALLFANSFGGEIGFRSYLFALPFLAWYGAAAIWPLEERSGDLPARGRRVLRSVVASIVLVGFLVGFAFAHYGKDSYYRFSPDEVAASAFVLDRAVPGTLLVTVSANYPGQFRGYEDLTYVPIAREPKDSRDAVLADPVASLTRWLSGEYADGYILLTRSQQREAEAIGTLPPGAYAALQRALDTSPRFEVVWASPDAQVYRLVAEPEAGP